MDLQARLQALANAENYGGIWRSFHHAETFANCHIGLWFDAWLSVRLPILSQIARIEGVPFLCVPSISDDEPHILGSTGLFSVRELRQAKELPSMNDIDVRAMLVRSTWTIETLKERRLILRGPLHYDSRGLD